MALTATATMRVREDIVKVLGLGKKLGGDYHCCVNTFHRSNLYFAVHHTKTARLANLEKDLSKYLSLPSASHSMGMDAQMERHGNGAPSGRGKQPSAAFFFRESADTCPKTLRGGRPLQVGPAMRAHAAAQALSTVKKGASAAGPSRVQANEIRDYPRNKTITCPLCDMVITYPEGASPDAVIGAHLDSSCGTMSAVPVRNAGGSDVGLRGGDSSRSSEGHQLSSVLAVKQSIESDDDDNTPLAHLAGKKRARLPEDTHGSRVCKFATPAAAALEAITISDSDESSDSDEIEIVDADSHVDYANSHTQVAPYGGSAPCIDVATGNGGGETMPIDEELAALEMLDEEIARQRGTLTDISAGKPQWGDIEVDENGVVIEDEPDDLGEYSRPSEPQFNLSRAQPVMKERSSTGCRGPVHAPFATGTTIVYAPTRVDVENIAAKLKVHLIFYLPGFWHATRTCSVNQNDTLTQFLCFCRLLDCQRMHTMLACHLRTWQWSTRGFSAVISRSIVLSL